MTDTNERSIIKNDVSLPSDDAGLVSDTQKPSGDSHSDSHHHHRHHHHHHRHHDDDGKEHHHHHHDDDGKEHHHHHHHHLKDLKKNVKAHGASKYIKSRFLKFLSKEKKKAEDEKTRILKRAVFLVIMLIIFAFCFYMIVVSNIDSHDVHTAKKSPSETDLLQKQLSKLQSENQFLKNELQAYKDAFGELDFNNIKK